jgi:hypothetical protein
VRVGCSGQLYVPLSTKNPTDWSKCCLCQEDTKNEDLTSPPTHYTAKYDGYCMIAAHIPLFQEINELPVTLDPARLDEGGGILETLRKKNAKYHLRCRIMYNNTKLERAKKRASTTRSCSDDRQRKLPIRRSIETEQSECFLCEEEAQASTRQAMTMQLDERLHKCAQALNDGKLLTKLSGGDVVAHEMKYHPTCLAILYNRERAVTTKNEKSHDTDVYRADFLHNGVHI